MNKLKRYRNLVSASWLNELIKTGKGHYIKTVCKDIYKSATVKKKEPVIYKTYFEQYTVTKGKIRGCKELSRILLKNKAN